MLNLWKRCSWRPFYMRVKGQITVRCTRFLTDKLEAKAMILQSPDEISWSLICPSFKNVCVSCRCKCNLHASQCTLRDATLQCECDHNTSGQDCQRCSLGFGSRSWKPGSYLPLPKGTANICMYLKTSKHIQWFTYLMKLTVHIFYKKISFFLHTLILSHVLQVKQQKQQPVSTPVGVCFCDQLFICLCDHLLTCVWTHLFMWSCLAVTLIPVLLLLWLHDEINTQAPALQAQISEHFFLRIKNIFITTKFDFG